EKLNNNCRNQRSSTTYCSHENPRNKRHKEEQENKMTAAMPFLPFQVSTEQQYAAENNGCVNQELAIVSRVSECYPSRNQNQKHVVGTARVTVINKKTTRKAKCSIRSVWTGQRLSR